MKISLMSSSAVACVANGSLDSAVFIARLAGVGITGLEVFIDTINAYPDAWREIHARAVAVGFGFPSAPVGINLIGNGTPEDLEAALDKADDAFRVAASFGCHNVLIYSTMPAPGMDYAEARCLYGQQLRRASVTAARLGVRPVFEDYGGHPDFSARASDCRVILDAAGPDVGFNFDNANFVYGDDSPSQALSLFGGRIVHVHIKDVCRVPPNGKPASTPLGVHLESCPPGEGAGEIVLCLRHLKASGYDGWLSCETGDTNFEVIERMANFIRSNW